MKEIKNKIRQLILQRTNWMGNQESERVGDNGVTHVVGGVFVLCAMILPALLSCLTVEAAGDTYPSSLEASYGATYRSVYEDYLAGSPLETECADGVDPSTGHLILTRSDLYLEGMGGMDFELTRYYDSNEANLGHATVEHLDSMEVDTVWVDYTTLEGDTHSLVVNTALLKNHKKALKDLLATYTVGDANKSGQTVEDTERTTVVNNVNYNVYGIASGWSYDFPWIETVTLSEDEGWDKIPAYLHFGNIGTIGITYEADTPSKSYTITGLDGYEYDDIKLEDYDQTVDGILCRYLLRDKTGLRTYFNEDGVIVLQKDVHDNTIKYEYTDNIYFSKITDSVGREIDFHYSGTGDEKVLSSVTVEGESVEGGVSSQTVKYSTKEQSYTPLHGESLSGYTLASATVAGSKETYEYKTVERLVNTAGAGVASQRVSTNESYLLNQITADGTETHYTYRASSLRGAKELASGQKRDVVTEQFYVTREYEQSTKTGKKSNGIKYDYFQKQDDTLISFADFSEGEDEVLQYGNDNLKTLTVISRYNPNKYKANGKYYDIKYKKSKIDTDTLHLEKNTKKNVTLNIYHKNKMLIDDLTYGKDKEEAIYTYDKDGVGSLVTLTKTREYDKDGKKASATKQGTTYDIYRNVITEISSPAYRKKNKGKEYLYTTTYTYYGTDEGYPAEDTAFTLCTMKSQEEYTQSSTKTRLTSSMTSDGIDYASILEERSINGADYETITRTDYQYDDKGNEIKSTSYPSYSTDGTAESIENNYTYNSLGQQTKTTVTITSASRPQDNRTYTEEEVTYDSFGNELTYTDENGLVSQTTYDPETGDEAETVDAVRTEYESQEKEYVSADSLKTMTVDNYGRVSIEINDAFGNTILSKDEASGTWTEYTYDYGDDSSDDTDTDDTDDDEDDDSDEDTEEAESIALLLEEKTYAFTRDEKKFIINDEGETVPNYYMTGRGDTVLSATKYFYDDLGNEIGTATFANGELDAEHCSSWSFHKSETVTRIDDSSILGGSEELTEEQELEAQITITEYTKELNPSSYDPEVEIDPDDYYDQFGDVLTETITEQTTDAEGTVLEKTTTTIRGKNKSESTTTYEMDDFGKTTEEDTSTRNYQDGERLPAYETKVLYTYDSNRNVIETETKSKLEDDTDWISTVTKTDYDDKGQVIKEYTPRGTSDDVAARYTYDIQGRLVQSQIPQEDEDGAITYQTITTEYDTVGNVTKQTEQIDEDRQSETEYTYDKRGDLVMVKSCLEDSAQYVQYVYDTEGNKVRQFTGMTSPLTITVEDITDEVEDDNNAGDNTDNDNTDDDRDTFTYVGKTYEITTTGAKKSDTICETKYNYDGKNEMISYIDPMDRTETYTYDENGNLTKTVDKNRNVIINTYDLQNRLVKQVATAKNTGKDTVHTYSYNDYGDVATQDDTSYEYDDISGQVTKETTQLTKRKDIVKKYTYDSAGNKSSFVTKVGDVTELSLQYNYDGESKLTNVTDEKGTKIVDYTYDTDGNLSERTVAGVDLTTDYTYDYQNHLTAMTNKTSEGVISEYTSKYLLNGQKEEEISTLQDEEGNKETKTSTYTYDLLGRLTKETKTDKEDISYTYDSNNNRKEMTVGNQLTSYKYNKNDELTRTDTLNTDTKKDTVVIYKNDKNGNELAKINRYEIPEGQKDEPYIDIDMTLGDNELNENSVTHYNALNQPIRTLTKNYKVKYTYDADGLRTSKTIKGDTTIYVWDGDQIVLELTDSGKVKKRYLRGNDLVSMDEGDGTDKQYYVTDPHGNVVQLIDETGTVNKTYEYDSFGNEAKPKKKDENPYRYCSEYYDKETEEIYLRARYYKPETGRFTTRDTYTGEEDDPESLHLYAYCYNNPILYVDATGNKATIAQPLPTPGPTSSPKPGPSPQPGPAPDRVIKIHYGAKERKTVKEYCKKYAYAKDVHNPNYRWFRDHDCANFVSQCLFNASFEKTMRWNYTKRTFRDSCTSAWSNAKSQYSYFSNSKYAKKIVTIRSSRQISSKTKKVKEGDLLYWDTEGDGRVNHATIITSNSKSKGKQILKYGGHSNERKNRSVRKSYKPTNILKIIRLRDDIRVPYNL